MTAFVLSVSVISCKNENPEKLLEGSWQPMDPAEAAASGMKLKFMPGKIAVVQIEGRPARAEDSVTYELKKEGKLLATRERSGKTEEVQVLELTDKKLVLLSAGRRDTMKLVKVP